MKHHFKGKLLNLSTQKRTLPNGKQTSLEIVEHPGAVLIIPRLDANHYVLLRQYRPVIQRFLFEFPAGTINPGEKPLPCAFRELIEETGYQAKQMTRIGKIFPVPGYSTEIITIYQAQRLTLLNAATQEQRGIHQDPDEILSVRIHTKSEIKILFQQGKINDAKTICALAFGGIL